MTITDADRLAMEACRALVDTVNATGGVVRFGDDHVAPECDHDWDDLGEAYITACRALSIEPTERREDDEDTTDCAECLNGTVINDTCDECDERHCSTCDPCEDPT